MFIGKDIVKYGIYIYILDSKVIDIYRTKKDVDGFLYVTVSKTDFSGNWHFNMFHLIFKLKFILIFISNIFLNKNNFK